MQGTSPTLSSYNLTRSGGGLPITRLKGLVYRNLASMFKNKLAEPFWVKIPYNKDEVMKTTTCLLYTSGNEYGWINYVLGNRRAAKC